MGPPRRVCTPKVGQQGVRPDSLGGLLFWGWAHSVAVQSAEEEWWETGLNNTLLPLVCRVESRGRLVVKTYLLSDVKALALRMHGSWDTVLHRRERSTQWNQVRRRVPVLLLLLTMIEVVLLLMGAEAQAAAPAAAMAPGCAMGLLAGWCNVPLSALAGAS